MPAQPPLPPGMEVDIAVVGLGITGISALARALWHNQHGENLRVCGIEAGAPGKLAAMANSAGQFYPRVSLPLDLLVGILSQERVRKGAAPEEAHTHTLALARHLTLLAQDGCRGLRALAEQLKAGPIFDGVMHLARSADVAKRMQKELAALEEEYGLTHVRYVNRNDAWARLAVKRSSYAGGYDYAEGGYFDAPRFYNGLLEGLTREGVSLFHNCKAVAVAEDGEAVRLTTTRGDIRARTVVMAGAAAQRINPEVIQRVMHYNAHTFTANVGGKSDILRDLGAFEEEADPFLYVTRIHDWLAFGYADTPEKTGEKGKKRLEAKAVRKIEEILPWLEGQFHQWIIDSRYRSGRLSVTASGLPDLSEAFDGKVISTTGLSGLGHAIGETLGRKITDDVVRRRRENARDADYIFLRDELPKGRALSAKEKTAYVDAYLSPRERIALHLRRPDWAMHI